MMSRRDSKAASTRVCTLKVRPGRALPAIFTLSTLALGSLALIATPAVGSTNIDTKSSADIAAGETIIVTGSVLARRLDDAPYSISTVGRDALRGAGPMMNLSEALGRVPGLSVNNRSNFAQDLQITSRGFGSRATFGVRGVRLYADGIPASGPDGQGQVSHMDIAGASRVEVLRGPFSALYGNGSGGVISVFTAPVKANEWELDADVGSYGLRQARASAAARLAPGLDLRASLSGAQIGGFRPHSAADKRQAQARLSWAGERDTVSFALNALDQPAQDPLGLTRDQFLLGPDQVAAVATQFNTRKTQDQQQLGAHWLHRFDEGVLREASLAAYAGNRSVTQWLAIAAATQGNARHGGAVVDFDRRYEGLETRWRWAFENLDFTAGAALDRQTDARRGFENFTGTGSSQVLGVIGRLRRDELNVADSRDGFAQLEWKPRPDWILSAGLRSGRVQLSARDAYLSNGDDSGALAYTYTTPVLGARWQASPQWQFFASVAQGSESPTLGELAYRADGTGGFNTALKAQRSEQAEAGLRWRGQGLRVDLTAFAIRTADEIGVATNSSGRSAFQNVGRTAREGLELAGEATLASPWALQWSASALRARYRDGFLTCAALPCVAPTANVAAGNRIAGAVPTQAWVSLNWQNSQWGLWGLEWKATGSYYANDRNTASAAVEGHSVAALRWSKTTRLGNGGPRLEWLVRIDNLTGQHYAGSVIVNDANERYFEPGAPRSLLLALRLMDGF